MQPKFIEGPKSGIVAFLYELLRDHLPASTVEELVKNSKVGSYRLTNGYIADYAEELADRLFNEKHLSPKSACKFCGRLGNSTDNWNSHKGGLVCPGCWDERLRSTE